MYDAKPLKEVTENGITSIYLFSEKFKLEVLGDGVWVYEPDLVKFEQSGMQCIIKRCVGMQRGDSSASGGHFCGYCVLEEDHPLYKCTWGKWPTEIDDAVHGGITFSDFNDEYGFLIGFDCAHAWDISPGTQKTIDSLSTLTGRKRFTLPLNMRPFYKDILFVMQNCQQLAEVLSKKDAEWMKKRED